MNAYPHPPSLQTASAKADSNIALIKYWGKLDSALNLPAVASLSMTLEGFGTTTSVTLNQGEHDSFTLNGVPQSGERLHRVTQFLDLIREMTKTKTKAHVLSENRVPTAAGLASSASGFAALCVAATKAFGLELETDALSSLARRGSASAARSLYGPFAMLPKGSVLQFDHCHGRAIEPHADLDLGMVIAVCAAGEKQVSSRTGMIRTAESSPYYKAWVESHDADMELAVSALMSGDFHALGESMEHSTLKMHACMMAANPPLLYWNATTLVAMNVAKQLHDENGKRLGYFTMDAGPHVKVLCQKRHMPMVAQALRAIAELVDVLEAVPGRAAELL